MSAFSSTAISPNAQRAHHWIDDAITPSASAATISKALGMVLVSGSRAGARAAEARVRALAQHRRFHAPLPSDRLDVPMVWNAAPCKEAGALLAATRPLSNDNTANPPRRSGAGLLLGALQSSKATTPTAQRALHSLCLCDTPAFWAPAAARIGMPLARLRLDAAFGLPIASAAQALDARLADIIPATAWEEAALATSTRDTIAGHLGIIHAMGGPAATAQALLSHSHTFRFVSAITPEQAQALAARFPKPHTLRGLPTRAISAIITPLLRG